MSRSVETSGPRRRGREIWSFFSGAMGLDLGMEAAGLAPSLVNELDPLYCETIKINRPRIDLIQGDVRNLTGQKLRKHRKFDDDVYLMVGGPPCQSFSSGGKRAGLSDPRGNLIYEYVRLISEVRPKYFILENVANLATAALKHRPISERPGKHWNLKRYENGWSPEDGALALEPEEMAGSALRQLIRDISTLDYHIAFGVLDAADFGAPQHRLRFVMVGSRDYPPPALPRPMFGPGLLPYRTTKDAIWNLRESPGIHSIYTEPVERFFSLIEPGKNWRSLPKDLQKAALGGAFESGGGKTGFYRRLSWETPAPTITGRANRKGSALCHPSATRPISVAECAALQGFPADWSFAGAMNSQYMQIGNAVPVPLGKAIGATIKLHERSAARRVPIHHPDSDTMVVNAIDRLRAAGKNNRNRKIAA